jgi:hypothetical protein
MNLKLLTTAVAVLSIASVTASTAKSPHKRVHTPATATSVDSPEARYGRNDPYAVWVAGTYVGRDPDPRVRDAMIREFYHNFSNR